MISSNLKTLLVLIAYSLLYGQSLAQDSIVRRSVKKTVDAFRLENQLHIGSPVGIPVHPRLETNTISSF